MTGYEGCTENPLPRTDHCPVGPAATNARRKSPGIEPMGQIVVAGVGSMLVVSEVGAGSAAVVTAAAAPGPEAGPGVVLVAGGQG